MESKLCQLTNCQRIAVLKLNVFDKAAESPDKAIILLGIGFCCKTHMLKYLSKLKLPRYSKKRLQQIAGTESLGLSN